MTTTVALANMPASVTDVSVAFLDQTKLKLRPGSLIVNKTGTSYQAVYVYADGDPSVETTVTVNSNRDTSSGIWRNSIRLATVQVRTVDSEVQPAEPIETVVSWNVPGAMPEADKVLKMLGTCFSLAFNDVTAKVPNRGIFDAINWGLVEGLYS